MEQQILCPCMEDLLSTVALQLTSSCWAQVPPIWLKIATTFEGSVECWQVNGV